MHDRSKRSVASPRTWRPAVVRQAGYKTACVLKMRVSIPRMARVGSAWFQDRERVSVFSRPRTVTCVSLCSSLQDREHLSLPHYCALQDRERMTVRCHYRTSHVAIPRAMRSCTPVTRQTLQYHECSTCSLTGCTLIHFCARGVAIPRWLIALHTRRSSANASVEFKCRSGPQAEMSMLQDRAGPQRHATEPRLVRTARVALVLQDRVQVTGLQDRDRSSQRSTRTRDGGPRTRADVSIPTASVAYPSQYGFKTAVFCSSTLA